MGGIARESLRNSHSLGESQSRVSLRPGSGVNPERPRPRGRAMGTRVYVIVMDLLDVTVHVYDCDCVTKS